jgi:hypothetical protein
MRASLQSQGLNSVVAVRVRAARVRAALVRAVLLLPLRLHINEESLMSGRTRPAPATGRMIQKWQWQ